MNKFNMNDKVYFVDIQDHKIKSGTVQGIGVNKAGYIKINVKVGEIPNPFHVDQALVSYSKLDAKEIQKLEKVISSNMMAIVEVYNKHMTEKRAELLGEPEMPKASKHEA